MLTLRQYQVLNSCADDWELFYFPFAMVNYGGQVFSREAGAHCAQYADQGSWQSSEPAETIASDLVELVREGFMQCTRVSPDGSREKVMHPSQAEFASYAGYSCLTVDDHIQQFDYGPHEFKITERGIAEIQDPRYRAYDAQLGWPK